MTGGSRMEAMQVNMRWRWLLQEYGVTANSGVDDNVLDFYVSIFISLYMPLNLCMNTDLKHFKNIKP